MVIIFTGTHMAILSCRTSLNVGLAKIPVATVPTQETTPLWTMTELKTGRK